VTIGFNNNNIYSSSSCLLCYLNVNNNKLINLHIDKAMDKKEEKKLTMIGRRWRKKGLRNNNRRCCYIAPAAAIHSKPTQGYDDKLVGIGNNITSLRK
jgi:hypothetical protein